MDLSRVTAFADSEFWLRVATTADRRDGSRLRLVLAPLLGQKADELSRIEIVANVISRKRLHYSDRVSAISLPCRTLGGTFGQVPIRFLLPYTVA